MTSCYLLPGRGDILHLLYLFACCFFFVLKDVLPFLTNECPEWLGIFEEWGGETVCYVMTTTKCVLCVQNIIIRKRCLREVFITFFSMTRKHSEVEC